DRGRRAGFRHADRRVHHRGGSERNESHRSRTEYAESRARLHDSRSGAAGQIEKGRVSPAEQLSPVAQAFLPAGPFSRQNVRPTIFRVRAVETAPIYFPRPSETSFAINLYPSLNGWLASAQSSLGRTDGTMEATFFV